MSSRREVSIEQLLKQLVEAEIAEADAIARDDTKAQNRWADRLDAILQELVLRGEAGKSLLEELLHHELPMVRSAAASKVIEWAPERAVPVLRDLLAWSYTERDEAGRRPPVAGFVLLNTEYYLSQHFGIRLRDVVPLVLGIEEDPRPWT